MGYLSPTEEQLRAIAEHEHEGVIWMWNLLRFKDGDAGRASYQRYAQEAKPLVEKRGGRLVIHARGLATAIGPDGWDEALVVEYPSRAAFIEMVTSEEYQAIAHFRQDALVDSRLYMTTELPLA
jgi:uncharacterized protein (DUF1330 family)